MWLALSDHHSWTCSATQGKPFHLTEHFCSSCQHGDKLEVQESSTGSSTQEIWLSVVQARLTARHTSNHLTNTMVNSNLWCAFKLINELFPGNLLLSLSCSNFCQVTDSVAFALSTVTGTGPAVPLRFAIAAKSHQMVQESRGTSVGISWWVAQCFSILYCSGCFWAVCFHALMSSVFYGTHKHPCSASR